MENKTNHFCLNQRKSSNSCIFDGQTETPKSTNTNQSSHLTPGQLLRKYNWNPNNNFTVWKKLFWYQIKMGFLQAKKWCWSNALQQQTTTKIETVYFDIFTNYSNIKETYNPTLEKYDDETIKLNNYIIYKSKLLGKGGYSAVYLCQSWDTNKEYAIKVTEKNTRANKLMKKYDIVKEEVTILKRVHSKYIVEVYEIWETKNDIYIVMELMINNSLFTNIKDLTGFQIWRYFRNWICGVEHCHEIGKIVHRDINVNNVLISQNGTVKLSDFGISVIIEDNNDWLPCNSGPSTYTPPEKVFSNSEFYHGKMADMWLIGATLFHMVYKRPWFKTFKNITQDDYSNIKLPDSEDFNSIDIRIKQWIKDLWSYEPEKRPTFNDLQKNKWVTHNDEFPLQDIHEEALEYLYELSSNKITEGLNV